LIFPQQKTIASTPKLIGTDGRKAEDDKGNISSMPNLVWLTADDDDVNDDDDDDDHHDDSSDGSESSEERPDLAVGELSLTRTSKPH
jgi:hypothetical protein